MVSCFLLYNIVNALMLCFLAGHMFARIDADEIVRAKEFDLRYGFSVEFVQGIKTLGCL